MCVYILPGRGNLLTDNDRPRGLLGSNCRTRFLPPEVITWPSRESLIHEWMMLMVVDMTSIHPSIHVNFGERVAKVFGLGTHL